MKRSTRCSGRRSEAGDHRRRRRRRTRESDGDPGGGENKDRTDAEASLPRREGVRQDEAGEVVDGNRAGRGRGRGRGRGSGRQGGRRGPTTRQPTSPPWLDRRR